MTRRVGGKVGGNPVLTWVLVAGGVAWVGAATGCSNKLETGYEPSRLGSSSAQRRAYYAPPFSPEARAVPDRDEELSARRPKPGY